MIAQAFRPKVIALFAHPGHELRCLGFLSALHTDIAYLTDASTGTGKSRIGLSSAGLKAIGLSLVPEFSTVTDAELYQALLQQDEKWLTTLVAKVIAMLQKYKPDILLTDGPEGYNPAHDLCHFLCSFSARIVSPKIRVFATPLTEHPHDPAGNDINTCLVKSLDRDELRKKQQMLHRYGQTSGGMLLQEMQDMEARFGSNIHNKEILYPAMPHTEYLDRFRKTKPFYEQHGMRRVRENKYADVIRLYPHMAFALRALNTFEP